MTATSEYLNRPQRSEREIRAANGNYSNVTELRIARTSREARQDHIPLARTKAPRVWVTIAGEAAGLAAILALVIAYICFGGSP